MINEFLDWAQEQQDGEFLRLFFGDGCLIRGVSVWIVSTEQLLAWVQNPVPVSQLDSFEPLKCSTPQISQSICDGIPANEQGLLNHCAFPDFPWFTCVSPGHYSDLLRVSCHRSTAVPRSNLVLPILTRRRALLMASYATAVSSATRTSRLLMYPSSAR
jgi:hypothetical protein